MKSRFTIVEFPVFSDFIIHAEVTSDIHRSMEKYPGIVHLIDEVNEDADGTTVTDDQICFIFLKSNVSTGTIAHEAFHAIEYMMDRFGVELTGETVAYHLGYLVDRIFKLIRGK